jgi:hypothetical protein
MLRKCVCAAFVLVLCVGFTFADTFLGIITKVEGDKVTFKKGFKKDDPGESMTLPVDAKVKISKGKFNFETKKMEADEELKDGLKNKTFTEIGEKGVFATITTDKDNKKITEIIVGGRGGFKKKDKQ